MTDAWYKKITEEERLFDPGEAKNPTILDLAVLSQAETIAWAVH